MTVEVIAGEDGGLSVHDHIERLRCELRTDRPVEPVPVDESGFSYNVDVAVSVEAGRIELPQVVNTRVRNADNEVLAVVDHFDSFEHEAGTCFVEMSAYVKLYLRVEGPVTVAAEAARTVVELEEPGEIRIGVRSYHRRPAATITTTERPVDMMRAVSHLGSALKTDTPERSYPTLRGHPPELELGDRFSVPPTIEAPDTGVRIEVPPTLESVFPVTPLAYYLGAEVVPGVEPRLVTDSFEYPLDPDGVGFETGVERVLKQTFFLDCLTRTEGGRGPPLHERAAVSDLELPLEELFDAPPSEQLSTYLDVPYGTVEPYLPQWKLTAHVEPEAENGPILPFLVDDLAVVRTPRSSPVDPPGVETAAIDAYMRSDGGTTSGAGPGSPSFTRSRGSAGGSAAPATVEPDHTDSLEEAWVGEDAPVGASKAMVEAYRNELTRDGRRGDLDVVVVCNDSKEMSDEFEFVQADDVYGSREHLPFDVTAFRELTCDRLALVLESERDFLHYIGHIDDEGFDCADGTLDVHSLDRVGVGSFFLNACSSYEQGMELIRKGAVGGVVTLNDVINTGALRVGRTMARLLDLGFPLRSALDIARERSIVGSQYIVVGDGNADIAPPESLTALRLDITERSDDEYEMDLFAYPTGSAGMGTVFNPHIEEGFTEYYLNSGHLNTFSMDRDDLVQFLSLEIMPTRWKGSFAWSDEVLDELRQ